MRFLLEDLVEGLADSHPDERNAVLLQLVQIGQYRLDLLLAEQSNKFGEGVDAGDAHLVFLVRKQCVED